MKKWWRKSVGEIWRDLFANEKTRWIAILLFAATAIFQNWIVIHSIAEGETMSFIGTPVSQRFSPTHFTLSFFWNLIAAVFFDCVIIFAIIFLRRESKTARPLGPPA